MNAVSHNEPSGPTHPPAPPPDPPRRNANDDFRLTVYRGEDGDWYHQIVSTHNGQNVLREGYRNRSHLVDLLQRIMPELEIHEGQATVVAAFTIEDFDPADTAPPGDPDKDCTGEPDGTP